MAILRIISRTVSFLVLALAAYAAVYVFFRDQGAKLPSVERLAGRLVDTAVQTVVPKEEAASLPAAEGAKQQAFSWKYRGREYRISQTLYESYYRYYASLPTGVLDDGRTELQIREEGNAMFMTPAEGDDAVKELALALRTLGQEQKLSDDRIVELVVAFVQSIPYDQGKTDRRAAGQSGDTEKILYPYETLYRKTGVCQDKSYLAYGLLHELGYGVAIFLFPDPMDNHMAVGIKCPAAYANYDSPYCFVETTSAGNKIGMIPELSSTSRVATSDIEIGTIGSAETAYQPLGHVEIMNRADGREYAGIVDTVATGREIERLRAQISADKKALAAMKSSIDREEADLESMAKKLKKLAAEGDYDAYNDLVEKYNKSLKSLKKDISAYNGKVAASNATIEKYNRLIKSFYQN